MNYEQINIIHESLINGQRTQAVDQIKEYGLSDFFADYKEYLHTYVTPADCFGYFSDMTINYMRITNR